MKVKVIQPDLKLLLNSGAFVYPKVGDVIEIANGHAEIKVNNVEAVSKEVKVSEVIEQPPTKGLDFTKIDEPLSNDTPKDAANEPESLSLKAKKRVVNKSTRRTFKVKRK